MDPQVYTCLRNFSDLTIAVLGTRDEPAITVCTLSSSFRSVMSQGKVSKTKSENEATVLQQYNDDEGHFSLVRYATIFISL